MSNFEDFEIYHKDKVWGWQGHFKGVAYGNYLYSSRDVTDKLKTNAQETYNLIKNNVI